MGDISLVLDRKNLTVRLDSKTIKIERPDSRPERIPLNMIEQVVITGNPMVSCGVFRALAEENIPVTLIPARGGGSAAFMGKSPGKNAEMRLVQYRTFEDSKKSLFIARWLLSEKLKNQNEFLRQLNAKKNVLNNSCKKISALIEKLSEGSSISSLMGYEGAAALEYFKALEKVIPGKWGFKGRNRRPPRDPANALLSFSYVLSGSHILKAIYERNLDPAIGFLHATQPGRDSLMLDMLEPLRPRIDEFVIDFLLNYAKKRHFTTNNQDGCLLNKEGRGAYYPLWSQWLFADRNGISFYKQIKDVLNGVLEKINS